MGILHDFMRLKGKMKLLAIVAVGAWGLSIFFSKTGFSIDNPSMAWVGWFLGILVTALELALNDRTQKINMTLLAFGIIAYTYGVYTNVTGFWSIGHPDAPFPWFDTAALMSWFVGVILEFVPEPLFMFALGRARESDPLGAFSEAASGKMDLGVSVDRSDYRESYRPPKNDNRNQKSDYKPQHKPNHQPVEKTILSEFLAKHSHDDE